MLDIPSLKTSGIIHSEQVIGCSPSTSVGGKCKCTDCSDDDCGPNNPCGVNPGYESSKKALIDFLEAQD